MVMIPTFQEALRAHQAGQLDQAEALYQSLLSQTPHSVELLQLMGALYHERGQWTAAERCFRQWVAQCPAEATAYDALGTVLSESGQLAAAEAAYAEAVRLSPETASMATNWGITLHLLGRIEDAIALYEQFLRHYPPSGDIWNSLANAYRDSGRIAEAEHAYRQAIAIDPGSFEAHHNLSDCLLKQERYPEALSHCQTALELAPHFTAGYVHQGVLYQVLGELEQAAASYRHALAQCPQLTQAKINLAAVFSQQENWIEAATCYEQLLQEEPDNAKHHLGLGQTLLHAGEAGRAVASFRQAAALDPTHPEAYRGLCHALRQSSQFDEALSAAKMGLIHCESDLELLSLAGGLAYQLGHYTLAEEYYGRALALDATHAPLHFNLGTVYFQRNQLSLAEAAYRQAVFLNPQYEAAWAALGQCCQQQNLAEEALFCYRQAFEISGKSAYQVRMALTLPCIYDSTAEIAAWRQKQLALLDTLLAEPLTPCSAPVNELGVTNFYLAYQGLADRPVQEKVAQLLDQVIPAAPTAPHQRTNQGKPRIGILSRFFFQGHTIAKLNAGLIQQLDRQQFEVVVFLTDDPKTRSAPLVSGERETVVWLPLGDLTEAARRVQGQKLDLLLYAEVGMDPFTTLLASQRLAPVQCVTWGHPMTTGYPSMDYFLSFEPMESGSQRPDYSETVIPLQQMPVCYTRPVLNPDCISREQLGWGPDETVYFCAQSLFKVHPEMDPLLGGILRQDPQGKVAFIKGNQPALAEALTRRWERTIPDVAHRIQWVPPLSQEQFIAAQVLADVLLDTPVFSGGNTSLEALAFGQPVVTLPSPYAKGRITTAWYHQMGLAECVAHSPEAYIQLAVQLGSDRNFRQQMKDKILAAQPVLFDNPAGIRELEALFLSWTRPEGTP